MAFDETSFFIARSLIPFVLIFVWVWIGSFLILILFRFLANPVFWMDWTSWIFEAEAGLWLVAVLALTSKRYFLVIVPMVLTVAAGYYVYMLLGGPELVSPTLPKIVSSLPKLASLSKGRRVFVSGSYLYITAHSYFLWEIIVYLLV